MTTLRPELSELPERMKTLKVDARGYPVPWFVVWHDGEPEFRAMDLAKWRRAVVHKLCWVCGEKLGSYLAFVIGPMCGVSRTTSEPPCHGLCATWSARNCPFLSRPHMVRREDTTGVLQPNDAGIAIARNPGVTLVWTTRGYEVFDDGKGGKLIHMGEPLAVEFFSEGRTATRAEIEYSVGTGLPYLEAACHQQAEDERKPVAGYLAELHQQVSVFTEFYPAA